MHDSQLQQHQESAQKSALTFSSKRPFSKALGISVACSLLLLSPLANAASESSDKDQTTWFGEVAEGEWLAGVKIGAVKPDNEGFRDSTSGALVFGYQFARPVGDRGSSSIEIEFGTSTWADIRSGGVTYGEWDIHSVGLFFNYRSPGTIYFKGKAGVLNTTIHSKANSGAVTDFKDTGFAFGLGAGYRLGGNDGSTTIEAEWVSVAGDTDINYYNLGANFEF